MYRSTTSSKTTIIFFKSIDTINFYDIFILNMLIQSLLRGTGTTGTGTSPLRAKAIGALVMDAA